MAIRNSAPLILKLDALGLEADEAGFPALCIALQALARVSRLNLPDCLCNQLANSCIMFSDTTVNAFRSRGRQ
jgi:hypothetical protein